METRADQWRQDVAGCTTATAPAEAKATTPPPAPAPPPPPSKANATHPPPVGATVAVVAAVGEPPAGLSKLEAVKRKREQERKAAPPPPLPPIGVTSGAAAPNSAGLAAATAPDVRPSSCHVVPPRAPQ